ncbi:DNA primase [Bradyrhizobium sp. 83012]|uniref:DNA primase n=1 Tax=Bradyrhizobium aeschynomenes TaxID=2734909 RepID=A0ABX2CP74_9BRAD|nr:phage/plasmid primase, P4 family [Bradyrhizobium aeschynomenes]NPU69992.1 DNA primase [Bradyrhizobium aeschynomenes]
MTASHIVTLIDAAPAFADAQPLAGEELRRAGLDALDDALAALRAAAGDARLAALDAAALAIGSIVGAEALNETFAKAMLEEAAAEIGLVREVGIKTIRAATSLGIKEGKRAPREFVTAAFGAAGLPEDAAQPRPERSAGQGAEQWQSQPPGAADRIPLSDAQPADSETLEPSPSSSPSLPSPLPPTPLEGEAGEGQTLENEDDAETVDDDGDGAPPVDIDPEVFRHCAGLDQSDVDNGKRLLAYFGQDLLVRQEDDVEAGQMLAWTGTHWDLAGGAALAHLIGQRVGDLIKIEAGYIEMTPQEARTAASGEAAARELKTIDFDGFDMAIKARIEELEDRVTAGKKARAALYKRRSDRRKWGVSTKNASRIAGMLKCAAPHLRRHPDAFNADPLKVATLTHTLSFVPVLDGDNPDPDGERPLVDAATGRVRYRLKATPGHDRGDMLTAVIPFAYDKKATAREFAAFLDLFQPEPQKRRTVQQYSGMSLTAQPVQRVMFHTGTGGNGKSVYLEVLARVLGDGLAVGVPAETVSGDAHINPSAPTPDIARCYSKRYLRIAELPKDAPLKMETIKKLTGGERWPVRTMYKGYFEFKPTAKPHMSGNGEPKFDGADGGLQRRLIIVEWSVTLPTEKHRDFEDVVSEIVAEGSGILNWLIAGALDFLNSGLVISDDVAKTTADHFAEMDPCGQFVIAHVVADPGGPGVTGRQMYKAFVAWCEANGIKPMHETRFGLTMKKKLKRDDTGRVRRYVDVKLVDVPVTDSNAPPPQDEPVGGWGRVPSGEMEI